MKKLVCGNKKTFQEKGSINEVCFPDRRWKDSGGF
jgi:hypothetical protein